MNKLLFIDTIKEFMIENVLGLVLDILSFFPKLMYFLLSCILSIIDMFQVVFRKLAGLDPIIMGDEITKGDTVYEIIMDALFNTNGSYSAINTIFWSLIILGVFMLIVVAIVATLRVEYTPDKEKGNSKGKIITNFIKALFSFAVIPVASIFGMYLANSLIGVIDNVTTVSISNNNEQYKYFDLWGSDSVENSGLLVGEESSYIAYDILGISIPTTQEPFSGMVFKASAYSCNRFRRHGNEYLKQVQASGTDLGLFKDNQITESKDAAEIIDTAFSINAKIKSGSDNTLYKDGISDDYYRSITFNFFGSTTDLESFSKYNAEFVYYFYDLWTFNFIISFVAVIVIGKLYISFILMLMSRIFEIIGLFVIAPISISLMPIDSGAALGRWRNSFIGKYALVLVTIFGINLVSPIINIMQTVKFFNEPVLDYIILTIMIVAALSAVNTLISIISNILLDKMSDYKDAMGSADKTSGNLMSGINATKTLAGGIPSIPFRTVSFAGRSAIGLVANGRENRIKDKVKSFGDRQDKINSNYESDFNALNANKENDLARASAIQRDNESAMSIATANYNKQSKNDRESNVSDFLSNIRGIEFAKKYYGGDIEKARGDLLSDGMVGHKGGSRVINGQGVTNSNMEEGQLNEYLSYIADRDRFEQENNGLEKGSAKYNREFSNWSSTKGTRSKTIADINRRYAEQERSLADTRDLGLQQVNKKSKAFNNKIERDNRRKKNLATVGNAAEKTLGATVENTGKTIDTIPGMKGAKEALLGERKNKKGK